jgi:hypothetical protein
MTAAFPSGSPVRGRHIIVQLALVALALVALGVFTADLLVGERVSQPGGVYALYTAGFLWNAGLNPYDPQEFYAKLAIIAGAEANASVATFHAPPIALPLAGAFASLPISEAAALLSGLQCLLVALVCALIVAVLASDDRHILPELVLSVSLLNAAYVRESIYAANDSLLSLTLLLATLLMLRRHTPATALLLGTLSINPFVALLMACYALLRRAYVALAVGALSALALNITPLLLNGLPVFETLIGWIALLFGVAWSSDPAAALALRALRWALQPEHLVLGALGIALVSLVVILARRAVRAQAGSLALAPLALISVAGGLFVPRDAAHTILLVPALLCCFLQARRRHYCLRSPWSALTLGFLAGMIVPWEQIGRLTAWPEAATTVYTGLFSGVLAVLLGALWTATGGAVPIQRVARRWAATARRSV